MPVKTADYLLFEEWLEFCRADGLVTKTIKGYRHNVNLFLWWWHYSGYAGSLGAHPENVTVNIAREYATYLREPQEGRWGIEKAHTALSPATIGNYSRPLKVWFNWLVSQEHISKSPFTKSVKFNNRKPDRTIKHLKPEELEAIFSALNKPALLKTYNGSRDYAIIRLFFETGIRLGEMLSIRLCDLDLTRNRVMISGKTGSRNVVFTWDCRAAIEGYKRHRLPQDSTLTSSLWYSNDGYPLTLDGIVSLVKRVEKKSGVNFHPHEFRHTFGLLMSKTLSPFELKELMGHSSITTTQIYVQQNIDLLAESYQKNAPSKQLKDLVPSLQKRRRGRPKSK